MKYPGERSLKTKVVLVQLGSPKSPSVSDVREYLKVFLGDPRVVDINPVLWKIILNLFVLPFRPARSAKLYSRIWEGDTFPLIRYTKMFADEVRAVLPKDRYEVDHAFLLSSPGVNDVWDAWERDLKTSEHPATNLLIIPMFPQYSESTIASGMDFFAHELAKRVKIPPFEFMTDFHRSKAFIDNSVRIIDREIQKIGGVDALVISFHGIPKRRVIVKEDPYYVHCYETYRLLIERISAINKEKIHFTFQSRFGSEEWLTPYTDEYVENLVREGKKNIAVYAPSFVADCLETIDELGHELGESVKDIGGSIHQIPCLNDDEQWAEDFARLIQDHVEVAPAKREESYYKLTKEDYTEMPEVKFEESAPLSSEAKKTLKIVFITLFLDLIGFSIIFPLFPALAKHYLLVDGDNYFLKLFFNTIASWTGASGAQVSGIVLFGGALGALYSLLQFFAAPLWGGMSDRIGRKPVLVISVASLALSYLMWFFSGSFTLLIAARFIGGIMAGNISTATAVVADVTSKQNRSKGMAIIGIAFALGFILGPALGGIGSLIDLSKLYPTLAEYGVNPFSVPALIAFILSAFNLFFIVKSFKETLPEKLKGEVHTSERTVNIFRLFKPLPYKGVNKTNFGYFLFLTAFSGMEFTLTFLAFERLGYSSMDNAYMFIFIGLVLAFVQGGVVRRSASKVGEKKMSLYGLVSIIPGLLLIAWAHSSWMLYAGLIFLAIGSAMVIPCLTSLVSMYSPSNVQGQSIGIFRSLGALARVVGPVMASIIYWRSGAATPYFIGAIFLVIPILLVATLPQVENEKS